jgi:hypothetical protein
MYGVRQETQTTAFNLFAVSNEQSQVRPAPERACLRILLVSRRLARIEERRLAGIGFGDLIMYGVRQETQTTAYNLFADSNEQSQVLEPVLENLKI